ncbi:MAG: ABC transporter ATP-binding protein [Pseudomonadota bacterium]
MIDVHSLSRRYGCDQVVQNVSFHIDDGEIVGLLGHNGAGKTTIMRMLSGYLEPSAGTIYIGGHNIAINSQSVQSTLGYLPENPPLYPDMLVADYLHYVGTVKGIQKQEIMTSVRQAIAATDLSDKALSPIATLSRGMKQRVGVAQAILGRPKLLILDEPTNGLDPQQTDQMRKLIQRMSRQATIILSTHIMQEVDAVCDRVLMLRRGELVLDSALAELRQTNSLLLRADDASEKFQGYLKQLPQVASVQQLPDSEGHCNYLLTLHDNADMDTAASNVTRCVLEAGANLYQLQPMVQGLESIFQDANDRD